MNERLGWCNHWRVEKFHAETAAETLALDPYEVIEGEGNLSMFGGIASLWDYFIGGTNSHAVWDNTNAFIGVGDGTDAEDATDNNLQGSNKARETMDATYPKNANSWSGGAGTDSIDYTMQWKASYESADANFAWEEFALFNDGVDATGEMLFRKVKSFGTKASGDVWTLTVTITIS